MTYPKDTDRDAAMGFVLGALAAIGLIACLGTLGLIAALIFGG